MKKKQRPSAVTKRTRSSTKPYPDNDPEWNDLEQRYSEINGEMRKLAQLLISEE